MADKQNQRLTVILTVVFGIAVAVAAVEMVRGSRQPESSSQAVLFDSGPVVGTDVADKAADANEPPQSEDNAWCRSYVFTRCNVMSIRPDDCVKIVRIGESVPRASGVAGCREAVDSMLLRASGMRFVDADASDGTAGESDAAVDEVSERRDVESGTGKSEESRTVVVDMALPKPDPVAVAEALKRIRELETEIAYARNTYVGTSIGLQSKLDEVRAIAEKLNAPEATKAYNALVERLTKPVQGNVSNPVGSTSGGTSGGGTGSAASGAARPQPVKAVPVSSVKVSPVTP